MLSINDKIVDGGFGKNLETKIEIIKLMIMPRNPMPSGEIEKSQLLE